MATLAVIFGHVGGTITANPDMFTLTDTQTVFFNTVMSCFYWHVPVFFTITGMLMLRPERRLTLELCIRKYAVRLLLAIFLFGVPFAFLEQFYHERKLSATIFLRAFADTVNGRSWGHLWYLYTLVGIYLFLPVFKSFTDEASRRAQGCVLALLLLYDFCIPLIDSAAGTDIGFKAPVTYPLFYLLLGRYLADGIPRVFRSRKLCAIIVVSFIGVAVLHQLAPLNEIRFSYDSPVVALAACSLVCLFKGVRVPERWNDVLWKLDRLCFGVYLIHPVFINLIYKFFDLTPASYRTYPLMTIAFFFVFVLLSFFVSWVMSLIPPLKKYIL